MILDMFAGTGALSEAWRRASGDDSKTVACETDPACIRELIASMPDPVRAHEHTVGRPLPGRIVLTRGQAEELTPELYEWLLGWPDGWTSPADTAEPALF